MVGKYGRKLVCSSTKCSHSSEICDLISCLALALRFSPLGVEVANFSSKEILGARSCLRAGRHQLRVPSFLPALLISFHPSFLPSFLLSFLPSFLPSFFPSFFPSFLPSFLLSFLLEKWGGYTRAGMDTGGAPLTHSEN